MNVLSVEAISPESIEAVFKYSHVTHQPFILTCNKEQVDYSGGYCMSTKSLIEYIKNLKINYLDADVLLSRNHCGPGYNGEDDLGDTFKTIETDMRLGFNIIHFDFSQHKSNKLHTTEKMIEAIKFAKRLNPRVEFEVGFNGIGKANELGRIRSDVEFYLHHCTPKYYAAPTGAKVAEDKQIGFFDPEIIFNLSRLLKDYNMEIREYGSDYLKKDEIGLRKGMVGMTIGHELGVLQTDITLQAAKSNDAEAFLDMSYKSKKWKNKLHISSADDRDLCANIVGYQNFITPEYVRMMKHINDNINIREKIINAQILVLDRYLTNER